MSKKQNNIFKVIRFYDPNDSKQRLSNYHRGKKGSKNITYIDYITRKESCILKALHEKSLQENRELNEFMLESTNEWKQKWLDKGIIEEFLKASINVFDNSKFLNYESNFKTKLFNPLDEKGQFQKEELHWVKDKITIEELKKTGFIVRKSAVFNLAKENEEQMWKEFLEIDRESEKRQKSIEEYKKTQWGTGLYTNQAKFKNRGVTFLKSWQNKKLKIF